MIESLAALYVAAGLLLGLRVSRREVTHDWPVLAWAWVVCCWPVHLGHALWVIARTRWASAEVRLLSGLLRACARRLARRGCTFSVE